MIPAHVAEGSPLWWALVTFAACVAVVVIGLWLFEEFHAWQDRMAERSARPIPGMDRARFARDQWPRIAPQATQQEEQEKAL